MPGHTTAEIAAAAGDVPPAAVQAIANDGDVLVIVDAATARELAGAWSIYHTNETHNARRPRWHDDVVALVTAAAHADMATGHARVARGPFRIRPVPGGGTDG